MQLTKWNNARRAIEQCKTVDEIKDIRDRAAALKLYAKQAGETLQVQNDIAEIKLRAERKAGELLKQVERKYVGTIEGTDVPKQEKTLPEGISKKQSHHWQQMASIPEKKFEEYINEVKDANEELTTKSVISFAKNLMRENRSDKTETPKLPDEKYRIIYADPPWKYDADFMDKYGHAESHYKTMTIDELCELDVSNLAADNAVLFLWATSPKLENAFQIINAWGFEYKTSFVWDKVKHNFGYYNSVRHELLLVAGRGKSTPDVKQLHDSVISIERSENHSEKPEYFRELIDSLYTSGRRIELFARISKAGWDCWGAEADGRIA